MSLEEGMDLELQRLSPHTVKPFSVKRYLTQLHRMDLYMGKFGIIPLVYLSKHMMTSTQNTGTSNQINCWF